MQTGIHTILCAVDFSRYSKRVVQYAVVLTSALKARLIVFHAVSFPRSPLHGTVASGSSATRQAAAEQARKQINDLMADYRLNWQARICHGDPVDEIIDQCRHQPVDLVIVASHGLTGLRRVLLGSIVEQLAHVIDRPLLVIRSKDMHRRLESVSSPAARHILVGCRTGEALSAVITAALAIAPDPAAHYHFVHAQEAPVDQHIIDPSTGPYGQVQKELQDHLLRWIESELAPFDIPAENRTIRIVNGHPGELLTEYADAHAVDLVVIGVHSKTRLTRRLAGSTADTLMRHAPCPVLTIPKPEPVPLPEKP